jgi:hypothetical protein
VRELEREGGREGGREEEKEGRKGRKERKKERNEITLYYCQCVKELRMLNICASVVYFSM